MQVAVGHARGFETDGCSVQLLQIRRTSPDGPAFGLSGQKCSATSRLYVDAKVADALTEKLLPPTHREIAAWFGWSSNAAAKCHLLALEKKGFK